MPEVPATAERPGHLAENVMHFGRVLRAAGMPVGTDRLQLALSALALCGLESRADFKATLAATLIDRAEQIPLFEQAFYVFWRDPDLLGRIMAMLLPRVDATTGIPAERENRRLADALFPVRPEGAERPPPPDELEVNAELTWSDREVLRRADFETMTAAEWAEAKRMVRALNVFFQRIPSRRTRRASLPGVLDWRETLRAGARSDLSDLRWRQPRQIVAPLVVLADISGSMSKYSRMLLHFAHALLAHGSRVETFVFGTRLSRITRLLRQRDPDLAVAAVQSAVEDWSGGTRISVCLADFNRNFSRRVLAQNATVLLITDGLEHGDAEALSFQMERLSKSCRRLVWLNPLLRYEAFAPRASGIRAMLPWVDAFVPAHNIASLEELGRSLAEVPRSTKPMRMSHATVQ